MLPWKGKETDTVADKEKSLPIQTSNPGEGQAKTRILELHQSFYVGGGDSGLEPPPAVSQGAHEQDVGFLTKTKEPETPSDTVRDTGITNGDMSCCSKCHPCLSCSFVISYLLEQYHTATKNFKYYLAMKIIE